MSLDIYISARVTRTVYRDNITHNLRKMALEARIYKALWWPEELGATKCKHIIPILEKGIIRLEANPTYYKQFNPENGWGDYEGLLKFAKDYLEQCKLYPNGKIRASR
jgi:hypothetical protein